LIFAWLRAVFSAREQNQVLKETDVDDNALDDLYYDAFSGQFHGGHRTRPNCHGIQSPRRIAYCGMLTAVAYWLFVFWLLMYRPTLLAKINRLVP